MNKSFKILKKILYDKNKLIKFFLVLKPISIYDIININIY